ncbi:hypothetical protein ABEB36_013488 [Hypothenemus hampei]|uniref:RanBD1 domain-containing protein n=1 Tax=Hypothenemus hampei TaxID=57062 RepID=A0ABD1E4B6_HYPHA
MDFPFTTNIPQGSKTNGIDKDLQKSNPTATKPSSNIFSTPFITSGNNKFSVSTNTRNTVVPNPSIEGNRKSEKYCARLKGLNESVSKWIKNKVEENPLISLEPIFKDYEKYLEEIEKEELKWQKEVTPSIPTPTFNFNPALDKNIKTIPSPTSAKFSKEKEPFPSLIPWSNKVPTSNVNSSINDLGASKFPTFRTTSTNITIPTFSFGSNNNAAPDTSSFPASTGFAFENKMKPENGNADEDEPPKVEFQPVVEDDHIYCIRCKVFVKKGENFGDRGVGNLYLKPIENSEKVQLIVRADTNLGNLLLNFILSKNVPTKRLGKKDVMLVAIPTPDAQPPPTPLLLRVKSPEEADTLLEILEKHKK